MNKDLSLEEISYFMSLAIQEAKKAAKKNEVPVGAIIVDENKNIISKGFNQVESKKNPLKHAEIVAIEKALKKTKEKYLFNKSIFVTLEPCSLCATAISFVKIKNLYFAANDEKGGAIINGVKLYENQKNLYKPNCKYGYYEKDAGKMLKDFFKDKRKSNPTP